MIAALRGAWYVKTSRTARYPQLTDEERKEKHRAYMREWRAKNPARYADELARNRDRKYSSRNYQARKSDPEFKASKKKQDRTWYQRNRESILGERGAKKYGLTKEEYEARLASNCDICGKHEPRVMERGRGMHVDHNHETGITRGTLCGHCNRGLGYFMDSPSKLEAAAKYLRKHGRLD